MTEFKIYDTPQLVAREFAEFFQSLSNSFHENGKELHVALSGGSTPKLWFNILAGEYKERINWKMVHFYWGDERMVPAIDRESNYGEAKRLLFDKIPVPTDNIHPIVGTTPAKDEAKRYSELLLNNLHVEEGIPVFDLVILGMGPDGHTASIFPNQMELLNSREICDSAYHPGSGQARVTITGRVINKARYVAFLITGKDKAPKLKSIFDHNMHSGQYPAAHVSPLSDMLFYFVDTDAAQRIL